MKRYPLSEDEWTAVEKTIRSGQYDRYRALFTELPLDVVAKVVDGHIGRHLAGKTLTPDEIEYITAGRIYLGYQKEKNDAHAHSWDMITRRATLIAVGFAGLSAFTLAYTNFAKDKPTCVISVDPTAPAAPKDPASITRPLNG